LTDVTEFHQLGVMTGAGLINKGIEIFLPEPSTAKVVLLQRVHDKQNKEGSS
jgi:hypothetical protein